MAITFGRSTAYRLHPKPYGYLFSLRDGFTDSFVLFPATGFLAAVVGGFLRQLDASIGASEPHDFPVREQRVRLSRRLASIASCPASVTIASRPCEEQDAHIRKVFRFR